MQLRSGLEVAVTVGLAVALSAVSGCRKEETHSPTGRPEVAVVNPHLEPARAVLEEHCGRCHRADSPDAVDGALRIFTLNDQDWARQMTRAQLDTMRLMVTENHAMSPSDKETIAGFVGAALAGPEAAPATAESVTDR